MRAQYALGLVYANGDGVKKNNEEAARWYRLAADQGNMRAHRAALGVPIVGDGKYGGRHAFLTGGVSRKLHLHARALAIPHPAGGTLDVTAPLEGHMLKTWQMLGFDPEAVTDQPDLGSSADLDLDTGGCTQLGWSSKDFLLVLCHYDEGSKLAYCPRIPCSQIPLCTQSV